MFYIITQDRDRHFLTILELDSLEATRNALHRIDEEGGHILTVIKGNKLNVTKYQHVVFDLKVHNG